VAGFTGLLMAGRGAGVAVSAPDASKSVLAFEETVVFGKGASGLVDSTFPDRTAEGIGVAFISVTEVAAGIAEVRGASPEIVLQHIRTSAVKIKDHLSCCRPEGGVPVHCNFLYFTVPPDRVSLALWSWSL
jgi:hypothetical protein